MNGNDFFELSLVLKKFLSNNQPLSDQEKHKMMYVMYALENKLYKIKADYSLHYLDNSIISESVAQIFFEKFGKRNSLIYLRKIKFMNPYII